MKNNNNMKVSDFILIQIDESDEFYELGRVRPYFDEEGEWDEERGYYCAGLAQNNGSFYEFSIHLGNKNDKCNFKYINIGYPVKMFDGQKVPVFNKKIKQINFFEHILFRIDYFITNLINHCKNWKQ